MNFNLKRASVSCVRPGQAAVRSRERGNNPPSGLVFSSEVTGGVLFTVHNSNSSTPETQFIQTTVFTTHVGVGEGKNRALRQSYESPQSDPDVFG